MTKMIAFLALFLASADLAAETEILITPKDLKAAMELPEDKNIAAPQVFVYDNVRRLVFVGVVGRSQSVEEIVDHLSQEGLAEVKHPISNLVRPKLQAMPTLVYIAAPEKHPCLACDQYYPTLDEAIARTDIKIDRVRIELDVK